MGSFASGGVILSARSVQCWPAAWLRLKGAMPEEEQGNAGVGLISPPPDIRGVIDKTAQFVAKCGPEFEQRVLREQNHTKFAFLLPSNPYRAYYEYKVKEFKTGVTEETK